LFQALKPDVVIQAAATTSGSKDIVNNPSLHVTDNAVMNSYIFREAVSAKVKHVVFFSCTVMYPSSDVAIPEDTAPDPHPRYFGVAHTKMYIEKMAEFYSRIGETKFTVIRHSNIYGPHDKFDL
jgi:nucleoside-diphosphate-sugar epimerase